MRGKAHLRIVTWAGAIVLALVCSGSYPSQNSSPNLRPYKPRGWSDVIVVSNRQGDNLNSGRLVPSDIIYVDFAVINSGGSPVTRPFRIDLLVDGQLWKSFDAPAPLDPQVFVFARTTPSEDWASARTHYASLPMPETRLRRAMKTTTNTPEPSSLPAIAFHCLPGFRPEEPGL